MPYASHAPARALAVTVLVACARPPLAPSPVAPSAAAQPPTEDRVAPEAPSPAAAPAAADSEDDPTAPDDYQVPEAPQSCATRPHAPVLELRDAELEAKVRGGALAALGAMSIGRTNAGALVNGVALPPSPYWDLVSPGAAYCTEETRSYLTASLAAVHARFPDTPRLPIGNASTRNGGFFPPHVSHQSGRDVDVGYYLTTGEGWYTTATRSNLDVARTWALLRALVTESDVEVIFVDRRIQLLLHAHAIAAGEDRAWIDGLFQYGAASIRPLVVHVRGHATHLHVRFRSPVAEELGRRAYPMLVRRGILRPPTYYVKHVIKPGETLSHVALRYRTTTDLVKKTNGLKTDVVRLGRELRVPQTGHVVAQVAPVLVPPRRVPPDDARPACVEASAGVRPSTASP